jgi:hypothetical protein
MLGFSSAGAGSFLSRGTMQPKLKDKERDKDGAKRNLQPPHAVGSKRFFVLRQGYLRSSRRIMEISPGMSPMPRIMLKQFVLIARLHHAGIIEKKMNIHRSDVPACMLNLDFFAKPGANSIVVLDLTYQVRGQIEAISPTPVLRTTTCFCPCTACVITYCIHDTVVSRSRIS